MKPTVHFTHAEGNRLREQFPENKQHRGALKSQPALFTGCFAACTPKCTPRFVLARDYKKAGHFQRR